MRSNYHESHVIECAFVLASDSITMCEICIHSHNKHLWRSDPRQWKNEKKIYCVWHIRNFATAARVRATDPENFYSLPVFLFLSATCEQFLLDKRVSQCLMMTYLCVWNFLNLKTLFTFLFHRRNNSRIVAIQWVLVLLLQVRQMLGNSWMY